MLSWVTPAVVIARKNVRQHLAENGCPAGTWDARWPVIARAISLIMLPLPWARFPPRSLCISSRGKPFSFVYCSPSQSGCPPPDQMDPDDFTANSNRNLGLWLSQRMADTFICTLLFEWHVDRRRSLLLAQGWFRMSHFVRWALQQPSPAWHYGVLWTRLICHKRIRFRKSKALCHLSNLVIQLKKKRHKKKKFL